MQKGDRVQIVNVPNATISPDRHLIGLTGRVAAVDVQPSGSTTVLLDAPPEGRTRFFSTAFPEHLHPAPGEACPECEGVGTIDRPHEDSLGFIGDVPFDCWACAGVGVVQIVEGERDPAVAS